MRTTHTLLSFACLFLSAIGGAVAQTSGTYSTGTGYSIEVKFEGSSLFVVEPNKRSEYKKTGANVYEFTNANNNNIRYGIRVIDESTLEAFKPGSGQPGTRLALVGAPAGKGGSTASAGDSEKYERLAQAYLQRAQTDPNSVHVWSACGAAAFSRASSSSGDADAYARQTASMIKPIMTDRGRSPCPDAISDAIWARAE